MPIMTRMRESMPVVLFGLLILFVVMIVFEWGMDYLGIRGARNDAVGAINGEDHAIPNSPTWSKHCRTI